MKPTLLDIVQRILSAMDSEEVNSINDTVEAQQVALVVQECYEQIASRGNLPEHYTVFQLDPSLDPDIPITMSLPAGIDNLLWIQYNKTIDGSNYEFDDVAWLEPKEFLARTKGLDTSLANVATATLDIRDYTLQIRYETDRDPDFYTSFDDRTLVFNSFNSDYDTTLQSSKTQGYGLIIPTFTLSDNFVPDLDHQQFVLLINEAKALAFAELKQVAHAKAEKVARNMWISSQHNKKDGMKEVPFFNTLPNYGRK